MAGPVNGYKAYIGDDTEFFVSVGNPCIRERIQKDICEMGGIIATLIHPSAVVSDSSDIGVGSVVMAGAIVNADARIGNGVIINTFSSVDHDCVIGAFSHISVELMCAEQWRLDPAAGSVQEL